MPFLLAEHDGVRNMLAYFYPDVKVRSRHITRNDVLKMSKRETERSKQLLHFAPGKTAFTSDCWTFLNTDDYISVTAHSIDDNCVYKKEF